MPPTISHHKLQWNCNLAISKLFMAFTSAQFSIYRFPSKCSQSKVLPSKQTFLPFQFLSRLLFSEIFTFTRISSRIPRKHPARGYKNKKEQNNFLWFIIFFVRSFLCYCFCTILLFLGGEKMNITWIETVNKTWSREEKIFHCWCGWRKENFLTAKSISYLKCFWFQWFMMPGQRKYMAMFLSFSPNCIYPPRSINNVPWSFTFESLSGQISVHKFFE